MRATLKQKFIEALKGEDYETAFRTYLFYKYPNQEVSKLELGSAIHDFHDALYGAFDDCAAKLFKKKKG